MEHESSFWGKKRSGLCGGGGGVSGVSGVLLATAPPRRELKKFSSERVTLCLAPPKIGGFETYNG